MELKATVGASAGARSLAVVDRWHVQTKRGGGDAPPEERGDCVPACIASLLGLPLDAIPNTHGEGWWDRLQEAVGALGYGVALIDVRMEPPLGLWIASLPSLNLGAEPDGREAWHSVVVRGYELVHDPSLGKKYDAESFAVAWNDDKIAEGWVLAPLDPASHMLLELWNEDELIHRGVLPPGEDFTGFFTAGAQPVTKFSLVRITKDEADSLPQGDPTGCPPTTEPATEED